MKNKYLPRSFGSITRTEGYINSPLSPWEINFLRCSFYLLFTEVLIQKLSIFSRGKDTHKVCREKIPAIKVSGTANKIGFCFLN